MSYSVVIPFFNNGFEIFGAISSVARQSIPPSQIVVVDDCSSELAAGVLRSSQHAAGDIPMKIIRHTRNSGVADARNSGIKACLSLEPKFIAFCDADDQWLPNKMEVQLRLFCHPSINAVACCITGSHLAMGTSAGRISSLSRIDLLLRNYIQPSTLVVRASAIQIAGAFPPGRRYAEEGDLYNRLAETGTILFLRSPLVVYDARSQLDIEAASKITPKNRLSRNTIRMYAGNLLNILNCRRRGSLNLASSVILIIFLAARLIRAIAIGRAF